MRQLPDEAVGSQLTPDEYNVIKKELVNLAESAGITLDGALGPDTSFDMLGVAVASYGLSSGFYSDIGGANVYTLSKGASTFKDITSYKDGMIAWFKVGTTNTGASTLSINTLPVKNLVTSAGAALASDTLTAGDYVGVVYRSSGDRFEILFVPPQASGSGSSTLTTVGIGLTLPVGVADSATSREWVVDLTSGALTKSFKVFGRVTGSGVDFYVSGITGDTIPTTMSLVDNGTNITLSLQNNHTSSIDVETRLVV